MSDIIDEIDRLVDDQLAAGPVDDYNVNRYDRCWHCGRDWHGMPITERIETMRWTGVYDESYSAAEDDTPVLCQGSDFIGPMPAPTSPWAQLRLRAPMTEAPTMAMIGAMIYAQAERLFSTASIVRRVVGMRCHARRCQRLPCGADVGCDIMLGRAPEPPPVRHQPIDFGTVEDGAIATFVRPDGTALTGIARVVSEDPETGARHVVFDAHPETPGRLQRQIDTIADQLRSIFDADNEEDSA
ncbi:hypothetical protein E2F47_22140 [Mycobacterium eburneum]|nr:hypothetical protein [Mycobacterium eburneum]TDH48868.1 hypothetical protein E2F47_22140 [Mycobacterium eburneum]